MSIKRNGLGRNLSALLSTSPTALVNPTTPSVSSEFRLTLDALEPGKYQPRSVIDDVSLQELAQSIKQQGLLQPILVRKLPTDRYEIIAGERRWRASRLAGLTEVPVLLRQVDDETAMAMALVENLQREDLNPMDQARAMARLSHEFELTHQQIAELLGKSRANVSNFLRLLSLAPEVSTLLEHGDLDMGHARALLILDEVNQVQVAKLIVAKNLSVRETETLVNRVKNGESAIAPKNPPVLPFSGNHIEHLEQYLKAKIKVKHSSSGKGSLVIHYNSVKELEAVIQQILN